MKKKMTIKLLFISLTLIFFVILSSCVGTFDIKEIKLKDDTEIIIPHGEFSYEGKKLILIHNNNSEEEIALEEDMIPESERLKFFKIGEHEVKIVYSRLSTIMKIKVTKKDFDDFYELVGYTCKYDGLPHKVELNYELPEGATIEYLYGNSFINAGTYEVKAVISKNGYNPKVLSTTLTIQKADYDSSSIEFNNLTVIYDGKSKMIEATNIPNGVNVKYDIYYLDSNIGIKEAKEAGSYKIVAKFESLDSNYKKIENMEAILTIQKSKYDMSNVSIDNYTKIYDGLEFEPTLTAGSKLPSGVTVSFKCYNEQDEEVTTNANAGTYKVVASFNGDSNNYQAIDDIEATLIVKKKLIEINDKISFESQTVNYDGNEHSLELVGTLPSGVTYKITNNGKIYAGEYLVRIDFEATSENNELDVNEIIAYLIINKIEDSVKVLDSTTSQLREINSTDIEIINGELKIKGLDEAVYKISKIEFYDEITGALVSINELEDGKRYNYNISFNYNDSNLNKSITLSPASGIINYNE